MLVALDYDNTLAHTEALALPVAMRLLNQCLAAHEKPSLSDSEYARRFTGKSFSACLREVCRNLDIRLSEAAFNRMVREEEEAVLVTFGRCGLQATEGASELLQYLGHRNKVAIVSSSSFRRIQICLTATGQSKYILRENIFSAQDSLSSPAPKPDPAIYRHMLRQMKATSSDTIAVEDSVSGVRSAAGAGLVVVAYLGAYAPSERASAAEALLSAGARNVIESLREVPLFLR